MFHIVLYEPEIPPNTGNIIRLCANTGASLHLIHPLGFRMDDKQLRRAGLDYDEYARVSEYPSWEEFIRLHQPHRLFCFSTRGKLTYSEQAFLPDDTLVFGPETRGLPQHILDAPENSKTLRLPMMAQSRSLNLSNTVAVALYEAWRQHDFNLRQV